jgi:hypothetical protein
MAGGKKYKSTDWRVIWFNAFICEPEVDNHQKENGVIATFPESDKNH